MQFLFGLQILYINFFFLPVLTLYLFPANVLQLNSDFRLNNTPAESFQIPKDRSFQIPKDRREWLLTWLFDLI